MANKRYFTWDREMFTTDKTFQDLSEALKADPKDGRHLIRVTAERSATVFYKETITIDLKYGRINETQAEKESAAWLAWCKGSTSDCVSDGLSSTLRASSNSTEETKNERLDNASERNPSDG